MSKEDHRNDEGVPGDVSDRHWNPALYLRYDRQRLRPALDLLAQIPAEAPGAVVDLGCGAGNVTRILAERWPSARVHGIDGSEEMIARASESASDIEWQVTDLRDWSPAGPVDVIFSNAVLHWLDGHEQLLPRLLSFLSPGGCLAVQVPVSFDNDSHRLMRETLADGAAGGGPLGEPALHEALSLRTVQPPEFYYDLLAPRAQALNIWESIYLQRLEGENAVLEWVKGAALRPVLSALPPDDLERFLTRYSERLARAYPLRSDGATLYPFRRLFLVVNT